MKRLRNSSSLACAALFALLAFSCAQRTAYRAPDPAIVVAHSAGIVSRGADITVVLSSSRETAPLAGAQPFTLSPAASGTVSWSADGTRVSFKPSAPLKAGQRYQVLFDFAAIGEEHNGWFSFDIAAALPSVTVLPGELYAAWDGSIALEGSVRAEDIPAAADVERIVQARLGTDALSVSWSHEGGGAHRFAIKNIPRGAKASELTLSWNGLALGAREKGSRSYRIPAEDDFELLSVRAPEGDGANCLTLSFSKPLDKTQDLRGLISADGAGALRYETEGGVVRLYASLRWPETVDVQVEKGVRSDDYRTLAVPVQASVNLAWDKPEVRFAAGGVIIPSTQGTKVTLETRNLAKVYVEALRVYGDTMLQFLQVNELAGSKELKRVGEVVWSAELDLNWTEDRKNQWTPYALDLSPLLAKHPDGLFQLRVAFSREHIRYVSPNNHPNSSSFVFPPAHIVDRGNDDSSYWDYYEEYFDWNEYYRYREDPTHPAFYNTRYGRDRSARRNVLVSDVGILAKEDADGSWHVAATDLKSARPLPGASVKIYSYALRELASAVANKDGVAILKPQRTASAEPTFMVVEAAKATSGRERGYLKLQPSQKLAVSHFDIGGEKAETGIKGFIYGERGVWRPGDDIHLVFALFDRLGTLPAGHPVGFELVNPLGQVVSQSTYTKSVGGFYYIKTGTEATAPTGNWTARVRVGGKTFTKTVKVETVMPNRLKLALDYGSKPYVASDIDSMGLNVSWLHGAPAPGLKADVSMVLSASGKAPGDYAGFSFHDPMRGVQAERSVLFDGYLDGTGKEIGRASCRERV